MTLARYDVIVVGAGCAGLTAAIALARAGFGVVVVETAREIGRAGMLGGVCFAESLSHPDTLGTEGVEALAWERRLIERGSFATDGRRIAGSIYRDADAFRSCYTILGSRFTPSLADAARAYGVVLQTETTVESLIRDGRRIIGVATTRGPLYARLVFLAEGDAGLLLSREGLERSRDPRDQPAFLYCLQQVLELPSGAIEECFRVEADQGVAYDFLLRNPATLSLNARGQLCTNRQGLTLTVILPAKNVQRCSLGDPRQLLDWFVDMPALRPWLRDGQRGAWTATLLRTGGSRDVPYLIEDGLAVGGAAAGLGIDFPVLNVTGPATWTGGLLGRAAARIRAEGRDFDRDALTRHYLTPLQQTRYWRDMEFVQRWPGHLARTHVLFGHGLDLLLDSASVWAQTRRWLPWKLFAWLLVLSRVSWERWYELREELLQLGYVLRLRAVVRRPALARLLLDGALNAFRDLVRKPRAYLPPHGTLRLFYRAAGEAGRASAVPWMFRRWFERFRPVLAAACHILQASDGFPLSTKMKLAFSFLLLQINVVDLLAVAGVIFPAALASLMLAAGRYLVRWTRKRPVGWAESSRPTTPPLVSPEDSAHPTITPPGIHIAWRMTQPVQQEESVRELPHICPARVFEVTNPTSETVHLAVHAERCIGCQACWRLNPLVDWGRNGGSSPSLSSVALEQIAPTSELRALLDELERKLREFDIALAEGPALVDRPHNDYLEMLARYAQQLAKRIRESLHEGPETFGESRRPILDLADALAARAEERTRHTWEGRFSWAAADGRLLRQHHLAELRRLLAVTTPAETATERMPVLRLDWLPTVSSREDDASIKHLLADLAARRYLLETIETAASGESDLRAELLTALASEMREGLSLRTLELNALLEDKPAPLTPRKTSTVSRVYERHDRGFLGDGEATRKLLEVGGDWQKMAQLRVLQAEREELVESERRLLNTAASWSQQPQQPADDEVITGFARQTAHILAGKILLVHTFARVERGDDSEFAMVLLRVWLDFAATLLDEYTIVVRRRLHSAVRPSDRPLVEPDSGLPLRTQAEYLAAPATYHCGDFLLVPLDLLQPRLVPEMVGEKEIAVAGPIAAALLRLLNDVRGKDSRLHSPSQLLYLWEAVAVEMMGRYAAAPDALLDLESACARLILVDSRQAGVALRERCLILRGLVDVVIPRWLRGDMDTRARHLERDVLELEALKADFRNRLTAVWQVFGKALGHNADVQASCFALAEATAWLKAADSTLGRMAWLSRLCQAEDRDEPPSQQDVGRRVLAHCFAEIRDRLFRFDEDLAALRRGYYAPPVYAATLLLRRANSPGVNTPGY